MSELFEKEKIKKMNFKEFIDMRISSLNAGLKLHLIYEKDLIYQAILDEYLMMKTFLKEKIDES